MNSSLPTPTEQEEKSLSIVIEDWQTKTEIQRAICLCLLRGDDTHAKIGFRLGISPEDVRTALRGVWGIFYDRTQDKLWLK
jgi:hypothetical protein